LTVTTARWIGAVILAGSALQLVAAPRADQPLIDVVELALPSLRTLYFTQAEATTFADASDYAERYRKKAEQLNEVERRSRVEGQTLDDYGVARISSFLKSYGEMRKGEQFVMGEVRARARERIRWVAGLGLLTLALVLAPLPWRRLLRARYAP
jgi:zinc/manganese transport system permease protein